MTRRKLVTKVRVEESESEDEEEFEDSRENLPSRDPVEPSSAHEKVPLPANVIASSQPSSSSLGPTSQLGVSQDIMGEEHHEEVIDQVDLIEDAKFYQHTKMPMKLCMQNRWSFKISIACKLILSKGLSSH